MTYWRPIKTREEREALSHSRRERAKQERARAIARYKAMSWRDRLYGFPGHQDVMRHGGYDFGKTETDILVWMYNEHETTFRELWAKRQERSEWEPHRRRHIHSLITHLYWLRDAKKELAQRSASYQRTLL